MESHVIREVCESSGTSYETMEVVGPQMVLTMKMTTFAWNVYDGRRKVDVRLSAFFMNKERGLNFPFRTWTNGKPQKGSQNTHPYLNSLDTRQSYFCHSCSVTLKHLSTLLLVGSTSLEF